MNILPESPSTHAFLISFAFLCISMVIDGWRKSFVPSVGVMLFGAWTAVLFATVVCEENRWLHAGFTDYAAKPVQAFLTGAMIGTIAAKLIVPRRSQPSTEIDHAVSDVEVICRFVSSKVLIIVFFLGLVLFAERIARVGWSSTVLRDLRAEYSKGESSLIVRLGSHMLVLCQLAMYSHGIRDSVKGVNILKILTITAATAPLSLAQGGRTFLVQGLLFYSLSFYVGRSCRRAPFQRIHSNEMVKLMSVGAILLFAFSLLGYFRGGFSSQNFNPLQPVLSWPASSLAALDSWCKWAASFEPSHGTNILEYPFSLLSRLGLTDESSSIEMYKSGFRQFQATRDEAFNCPPTIIPFLVADFGLDAMMLCGVVFMIASEFCTFHLSHKRGASLLFLSSILFVIGMTVQHNFFNAMFYANAFWIVVSSTVLPFLLQSSMIRRESFQNLNNAKS